MISFNLDKFDIKLYFDYLDNAYLSLQRNLKSEKLSDDERLLFEAHATDNYARAQNVMHSLAYLLEKIKADPNDKYHYKYNAIRYSIHKALIDFISSKDIFKADFNSFSLHYVEELIDNFSQIEDGYDGFVKQDIDRKNNYLYESLLRDAKVDYHRPIRPQKERE